MNVCELTTLVNGAAAICGGVVDSNHLAVLTDRGREQTGGAHCRKQRTEPTTVKLLVLHRRTDRALKGN